MQEWIKDELIDLDMEDKRLTKRASILLDSFTENPSSSIPNACESAAKTKAAYRFFENERVEANKIREGFFKKTVERAHNFQEVLAISDATSLVYSSHEKLQGKGVLRNYRASGLIAHSCFIATPEEEVLGLTYQKCWGRNPEDYGKRKLRAKKDIKEKESYNWIQSFNQTQCYLEKHPHVIFVGDRGADMLALFNQPRKQNIDLLIRACFNRIIENNEGKLFEYLDKARLLGYKEIKVTNPKTKKIRKVNLEIRPAQVTLSVGKHHKDDIKSVTINAISAKEAGNNKSPSEKIHWRLLTTLPVDNLSNAIKCISYYKTRWLIERYHFVLKSGCKIEKLQLRDAIKIDRALALYSIAAWRLMYLTYLARVKPNFSCTIALEEDEWKSLCCYTKKIRTPPKIPPTIKEAVTAIAKIGGFQARKNDGNPGMKTVWIGLSALSYITEGYRLWCKNA